MSAIAASEPLAELRDIRKAFGGIHAVDGVSINLYAGEVVAVLVGREKLTRWHTLDDHFMEGQARKVFRRLNKNFTNIRVPVRRLSGGQRQIVAVVFDVLYRRKFGER